MTGILAAGRTLGIVRRRPGRCYSRLAPRTGCARSWYAQRQSASNGQSAPTAGMTTTAALRHIGGATTAMACARRAARRQTMQVMVARAGGPSDHAA